MVKFCPNCEKILRKITETTGVYLGCTSCGYRDLIETKTQSVKTPLVTPKTKIIDENPKRIKPIQARPPPSPSKDLHPDQLEKMGQEILLLELRKKKLEALLENLEDGRKRVDMANEVEFLTKKHQELLKQYKQMQKMTDSVEE
jgi:DNA-directed RNA polymerase subunit M/transcription elongation factor TFIIS